MLREFIRWLNDFSAGKAVSAADGWLWAGLLVASLGLQLYMGREAFWVGRRLSIEVIPQLVAALYRKVLRLPECALGSSAAGNVLTLMTSDVRRFEIGVQILPYIWAGPLMTAAVLVLIALQLDVISAVAGLAVYCVVIPLSSVLSRVVATARRAANEHTDDRLRLVGELADGALAVKMLGREAYFQARVEAIRAAEARYVQRTNLVRGVRMVLEFCVLPLASLTTFAVYGARRGSLDVATVYYVLALLAVPKWGLCNMFYEASRALTEVGVALGRLDAFLQTPEQASAGLQAESSAPSISSGDTSMAALKAVVAPPGSVALNGGVYRWPQHSESLSRAQSKAAAGEGGAGALSLSQAAPAMSGVRMSASPGQLVGVGGPTGAGKSTLLAALLGEVQPLPELEGKANGKEAVGDVLGPARTLVGSVAYCAQEPWIVAGTLRDNILFGRPWDEAWYGRVLFACCLQDDVARLEGGDMAQLGERGANLSGGQRARVALARACYGRPHVALLDDPLSAVDPRVSRDLFDRALGPRGLLAELGATRVLVTHQSRLLKECDRVLLLSGGCSVAWGTWADVAPHASILSGGGLEVSDDKEEAEEEPSSREDLDGEAGRSSSGSESVRSLMTKGLTSGTLESAALPAVSPAVSPAVISATPSAGTAPTEAHVDRAATRRGSVAPSPSKLEAAPEGPGGCGGAADVRVDVGLLDERPSGVDRTVSRLNAFRRGEFEDEDLWDVEDGPAAEERAKGGVSWGVYGSYCRTLGVPLLMAVMLLVFCFHGVSLVMGWWLGLWAKATPEEQQEPKWMMVYGLVTGALVVLVAAACALFFVAATSAATAIHNRVLASVIRSPLSFFHANPTGRILNRFSKDQGRVDDQLPTNFFDAFQLTVQVLAAGVMMAIALPVILAAVVPLAVGVYLIRRRYIAGSVAIERLDGVTWSPVAAAVGTSIRGLMTVHAYRAADMFTARFERLLTVYTGWFFAKSSNRSWLGFRLDLLSTGTAALAILVSMAMRNGMDTAVLALALTNIIGIADSLQWLTRQTCEVESVMASVERLLAYAGLPGEEDAGEAGAVPEGWPRSGAICYRDVVAEYRPDLPPCLCKLSFALEAGSSCGVVGRTGSGKSSLMLTLFRLIRVTHGSITLDGLDIARVPLPTLRRQLAVIPQDPVLFSGSLRGNLDPSGTLPDHRLWEVLGCVQLKEAVGELPGGLDAALAHGGSNLSVGQRQLFCLARALLQDAKVLALDEATANVDHATDELIQRAVHSYIKDGGGRVLIMIAHRIDTVMSADRLLVLSGGALLESGSPAELEARGGEFAKMVEAARHGDACGRKLVGQASAGAGGSSMLQRLRAIPRASLHKFSMKARPLERSFAVTRDLCL
ncbi:hypothetical protein HYH03_014353 [Edaphochlamys debaryana]|uniref:Uncharacterized protein n=1 Tax=Edaphochlamys debaryana TaxID=47281 RepID=A0A835XU73_9CHLO|nr:hypothetical protein HYH03_014353 [Edaphochlamys debaryana]|eukprot:KAG2486980.1 hypothetical protein HYH03_014353 [Edaphochlamys debaryana]